MSAPALILAALGIPLAATPLIWLARGDPDRREAVTLLAAAGLFAVVALLVPIVMNGGRPGAVLFKVLPGLALAFEVEPLGLLFALIASTLWIATSVYSIGYMRGNKEQHQTRYYMFFALALAATMGIALAANLFTLFIFYEALTIATYPLVTHKGTDEARAGGRTYLTILLTTSILFFLLAILLTWQATGTLDFRPGGILADQASPTLIAILLVLYTFGIGKAALMPFHRWLPAAMIAPTPVSALLHAVAVVKAGVFAVLKVVIYIFGIDTLAAIPASRWMAYAAAVTIIAASLIALTRDNLKARLAYSTVSQLAYIVLGAMLANRLGAVGGAMHIATHAFGKITLFFCAGAIYVATHKTEVSQLDGLGRRMPITMAAFFLGSLSIIGLPPMGGLWSKWYIALGTLDAGSLTLLAVLMVSSLLNIFYLMPIPVRAFFRKPAEVAPAEGIREAPWPCLVALVFSSLGAFALFVYPAPLFRLASALFAN